MKFNKISIFVVALAMLVVQGCTTDTTVDLRESDYGYVQFKLYKSASYVPATTSTRADGDELEYLADAGKIEVNLYKDGSGRAIRQSLVLFAANDAAAEFGLRSDKLKLLAGEYKLGMISIFDTANDEVIYQKMPASELEFTVVAGGLTQHDIAVDVTPRGSVRFTLMKDLSDFTNTPQSVTRSEDTREYTFDEIKYIDIALKRVRNNNPIGSEIVLTNLPSKFKQHFDEEDYQSDKEGWKTSSIVCDTLLYLEADTYRVVSYTTKNQSKIELEVNNQPALSEFVVSDNVTTDAKIKIALYETDEYIKDYYALYEIWKSLDGENWCYDGEDYPRGTNWDFDKDVDLWGEQPGVQIHSNGRVARLDLSNFGFKGDLSPAIGQLTELVELYLGTHNDKNVVYDPSIDMSRSVAERSRNRFDDQRKYLHTIHPAIQMSEPCARALMENGLTSPAISLYEQNYKESDIIDKATGKQKQIVKYDMNHGTLLNGLTSLPKEIGNLKKLEYLFIANGEITELPDEIAQLESLTDFELYNCSKMEKFPTVIAELPALKLVNISNNKQWSSEEINAGLTALARGKSRKSLEILYARENNLTKLTKSMFEHSESSGGLEAIGLLDVAFNKISEVEVLGKDVSFIQLYLDNNELTTIPHDAEGYFCGYEDVETFSVNYNKLTKLPNIFNAKSKYTMASVSFGGNLIDGCEGEDDGTYRGIRCQTLTLSKNAFKKYPKAFADSNSSFEYILLNACEIDEIPEGSFVYENSINLMSLDFSYNNLSDLPKEMHSGNLPYLYGVDISFNRFSKFPYEPLDSGYLTVFAIRSQRDAKGDRCLREWPSGLYNHKSLRAFYIGSNDLRIVDETISYLIYYLDISDNPNIIFDASDICYYWQIGAYILYYDKTQKILNCDAMLE